MKRKEGQDFEAYRRERKQRNENIREYLCGRLIFTGGTYNAGRNEAKKQAHALGCK